MNISKEFLYLFMEVNKINMNMYYKAIKSNLSFNDAINSFKNGNIIRLGYSIFDPKDMNIYNTKFSIDQITSNKWEVVDIDHDMEDKLADVRDMMNDINLDIDDRFYHEDKMDISSYWDLFNDQFVIGDDNLKYEFMKYYVYDFSRNF